MVRVKQSKPKKQVLSAKKSAGKCGKKGLGGKKPGAGAGPEKTIKGIPKAAFKRAVKQVTAKEVKSRTTHQANRRATPEKPGIRFEAEVFDALQEALESDIASIFSDAHLCASHRGAKTVGKKDFDLVAQIRRK